ncbi:Protein kinase domain [Macleaya cordata]|uniref:Protein kinase domain n=1 Tax=Macleaya cordata TaxID=56857 RepID=A0A200QXN6_MACCD|nr:Protein kinase domain [Macleaya cordata]
MDQQSRELLTWALVKVAQPGDRVIALHVLNNTTEILDRDGKSSLLPLVKAFDSVLAVYKGFCNLKQVDLKLKICRGSSSIRKVLVREAKSYCASKVIVGTSTKKKHYHHGVMMITSSSTSVAKYCARKLSKDFSVLAVNNGKIVFQRESSSSTTTDTSCSRGAEDHRVHQNLLWAFHRTLSKKCKELNNSTTANSNQGTTSLKKKMKKCTICSLISVLPENPNNFSTQLAEESSSGDGSVDNSMALVPIQTLEAASSSISLLIREVPELRPGWPLLQREILSNQQKVQRSTFKEISVVQWAMQLPCRLSSLSVVHPDDQHGSSTNHFDQKEQRSPSLDGESGAIVLVGENPVSSPSSSCRDFRKNLPKELESLHEKFSSTCRLFTYLELQSATSNFMPEKLIGKGGSSQVYKGSLPDGHELAVKIMKQSEDVVKEFVLEIEIITALHHKNIISLSGFCFEKDNLLLVYDFLSRGCLEENLHGNKENTPLGWKERFKVAIGVAEALDYLHSNEQAVIHRDVKSSNILLSDDFEPQLSDFGLAKWASTTSSHITCTDVAGTFGYLAPEYFMYGKVNEKIDVYAFGVVLLELLSGRKPISSLYPKGQESLVMWAKPILNGGKVSQLLDPKLGDNYDHDQMEWIVLAATLCIRHEPRSRPRMNLVLKLLNGDAEVIKWSRLQLSASDAFDGLEKESFPPPNIRSHLNLALLDVEDDSLSVSSIEQGISLEEYLQGRWSRSSSFD